MLMAEDYVDLILRQWGRERPDLDIAPMGIIGRLSRLSRHLERSIEETFLRYGLTIGMFDVLAALRRSGPPYRLSPSQLYNALMLSSGAMTNRIDRLEERRLVKRVPDPNDRRGLLVTLTPAGKHAVDVVVTQHIEKEHRILDCMSDWDKERFANLLRGFLMRLEATNPTERKAAGGTSRDRSSEAV
jgi:DNA-binding MarR family transcriptional regulator